MTRLLYHIPDGSLYPYPRADDEPVLGLDHSVYKVLQLNQQPEPAYDSATETLTQTEVIDWLPGGTDATGLDGTLTRGWRVEPIPTPPPAPDWAAFQAWMDEDLGMATAMADARASTDPPGEMATTRLATTLEEARRGDLSTFPDCWQRFLAASQMDPAALAAIVAHATTCNLPATFIAALTPPAPAA